MRALVVDDEEDIRALVRGLLATKGWLVDEASNGDDALVLGTKRRYDLVVLDERMPGLTGYETAVQLRQEGFTGPIVFYTAYLTPELDWKLHESIGFVLYIVAKPDLERLVAIVETLSAAA